MKQIKLLDVLIEIKTLRAELAGQNKKLHLAKKLEYEIEELEQRRREQK